MGNSTFKLQSPVINPTDFALAIPTFSSKILLHLDRKSFLNCRLINREWNSKVKSVYHQHQDAYFIVTQSRGDPLPPPSNPTFLTRRISFLNPSGFFKDEEAIVFLESCGKDVESIHLKLNRNSEQNLNALKAISENEYCPKLKELSIAIDCIEISKELVKGLERVAHILNRLNLNKEKFPLNLPVLQALKTLTFFPSTFDVLKRDYEGYGGFVGFLNAKFPNLSALVLINVAKQYVPSHRYILHSEIVRSTERHENLKMLVIPKPNCEKYVVKIKEKFPNLKKLILVEGRGRT